jgi:hypothetical protein
LEFHFTASFAKWAQDFSDSTRQLEPPGNQQRIRENPNRGEW